MSNINNIYIHSLEKLENWVVKYDYKGYEPFDGLSSFLFPLTFGNLFLERILQQLIRQSPINLRPLLGVPFKDSTKGRGYMAWGYLYLYQTTKEEIYREQAIKCLNWLIVNKSPLYEKFSWGNHFKYASRGGRIPLHEPTIVWTSLIGQAFLYGYELLKDERYLDVAKSLCEWIIDLPREVTKEGLCFSYVTYVQSSIHNSNMLGAAVLARTASITKNQQYFDLAKQAMAYSCNGQLANGAWYYGEAEKYHWIDNFHTGYNLDSLKRYGQYSGDSDFDKYLKLGFDYFKNTFFLNDGTPKYYDNRAYPLDIQCASQAIDTLCFFSDSDPDALEIAKKVAQWTINKMQTKKGYFIYRIYPLIKAKAPMIHWGQATMFKALSHLLLKLEF